VRKLMNFLILVLITFGLSGQTYAAIGMLKCKISKSANIAKSESAPCCCGHCHCNQKSMPNCENHCIKSNSASSNKAYQCSTPNISNIAAKKIAIILDYKEKSFTPQSANYPTAFIYRAVFPLRI